MAQFDELTEVALGNFGLVTAAQAAELEEIHDVCIRLFSYRKRQAWPPVIVPGPDWNTAYEAALETVRTPSRILPTANEALQWANDMISAIDSASPHRHSTSNSQATTQP